MLFGNFIEQCTEKKDANYKLITKEYNKML